MPAFIDKKTPTNRSLMLDVRADSLGVSQRIKKETKSAALAYAVKHNLSMAETFKQAIALLIESDLTPPLNSFDMSKIPSDVHDVSQVTLKFTKPEMAALKQKFGFFGSEGMIETLLTSHEIEEV